MGNSLNGKVYIVTGGSGYIGSCIAGKIAEEGGNVAIFDRNAESAERAAAAIPRSKAFLLDLVDYEQNAAAVEAVKKHFGRLDGLVTCAGGSARERIRKFAQQDMSVIRDVIEMNLFGALNSMRAVLPGMMEQKQGVIVNISSLVAIGGVEGCADYAAAKAGIIAAARTLAMEAGPYNITINCVCPGKVQRPQEMPADPEAFAHRHSFLNRLCKADDIADMALYFLSDKAGFITGQNFIIDGGRSLGLKGDH